MDTLEKIKEVLGKQLNIPAENITPESDIKHLGADSLDMVEMLMTLEDEYGITVPDEQAVKIETVKDIVDLVEQNKK